MSIIVALKGPFVIQFDVVFRVRFIHEYVVSSHLQF